jgi:hypothetical protein
MRRRRGPFAPTTGGEDMTAPNARLRELGSFLRGRRDRLEPVEAGIAGSGPRRTSGLRREEVADVAGVSLG